VWPPGVECGILAVVMCHRDGPSLDRDRHGASPLRSWPPRLRWHTIRSPPACLDMIPRQHGARGQGGILADDAIASGRDPIHGGLPRVPPA
jgi:hypothetical protein